MQNENPQKVKVTSSWLHSLSCLSAAISLSVATLTSPRLFKLSLLPSLPSLLLSHSTPPLLPYPPLSPRPPSDVQRSFNKISRTLSVYYCGTIKGCRAPWVPYIWSEFVCVCAANLMHKTAGCSAWNIYQIRQSVDQNKIRLAHTHTHEYWLQLINLMMMTSPPPVKTHQCFCQNASIVSLKRQRWWWQLHHCSWLVLILSPPKSCGENFIHTCSLGFGASATMSLYRRDFLCCRKHPFIKRTHWPQRYCSPLWVTFTCVLFCSYCLTSQLGLFAPIVIFSAAVLASNF